MNSLDLYIAIPVIIGMVIGFSKGLIKEIIGLVILIGGIWIAKTVDSVVAQWLIHRMEINEKTAKVLAFLAIFVAVAITLSLFGKILEKAFETISLGGLNKLVGGLFGGLKYLLIISLILNAFVFFGTFGNILSEEDKEGSLFYNPAIQLAPEIWDEIIQDKNLETPEEDSTDTLKNV